MMTIQVERRDEINWDWPTIRLMIYFIIAMLAGSIAMFVGLAESLAAPFPYFKWIMLGLILVALSVVAEITVTRRAISWQYTVMPVVGYYIIPMAVIALLTLTTTPSSL